jgi:hypothetical protein
MRTNADAYTAGIRYQNGCIGPPSMPDILADAANGDTQPSRSRKSFAPLVDCNRSSRPAGTEQAVNPPILGRRAAPVMRRELETAWLGENLAGILMEWEVLRHHRRGTCPSVGRSDDWSQSGTDWTSSSRQRTRYDQAHAAW